MKGQLDVNMTLHSLSSELLISVLSYLDIHTIVSISLLNDHMRDVSHVVRYTNVVYSIDSRSNLIRLKDYIQSELISGNITTLVVSYMKPDLVKILLECHLNVSTLILRCDLWNIIDLIFHTHLIVDVPEVFEDKSFIISLMNRQASWEVLTKTKISSLITSDSEAIRSYLSSKIYMIQTLYNIILVPDGHIINSNIYMHFKDLDIYKGNQCITNKSAIVAHLGVVPNEYFYIASINPMICWIRDASNTPLNAQHIHITRKPLINTYPRAQSILIAHLVDLDCRNQQLVSTLSTVHDIYVLNIPDDIEIKAVVIQYSSIKNIYYLDDIGIKHIYSIEKHQAQDSSSLCFRSY